MSASWSSRCGPRSASRSWSRNNGGAGGVTGINRVARAAPDGYTISVGPWGTHVVNAFVYSTPYDLAAGFRNGGAAAKRAALVHRAEKPAAEGLQGVIAYLKENSGKVTAASVGAGGSSAVCGYYFGKATAPAPRWCLSRRRTGVAGYRPRQRRMMCDLAANSLAQVRAGTIKAMR